MLRETRLVQRIGTSWNNGDNYLLSNGRSLAFRTEFVRKFSIPEKVISLDAYLYFENKKHNGEFMFAKGAVVYNRSPLYLSEHKKQSNRYSYSRFEIGHYFSGLDIVREYRIPWGIILSSLLAEFFSNPFYTILYCFMQSYVYIFKGRKKKILNPLWKIDESTKRI
jgi:cellulose synthase/poly-beta-1,6-N-acetylglucosamine synthase-like glycosyltransferase